MSHVFTKMSSVITGKEKEEKNYTHTYTHTHIHTHTRTHTHIYIQIYILCDRFNIIENSFNASSPVEDQAKAGKCTQLVCI